MGAIKNIAKRGKNRKHDTEQVEATERYSRNSQTLAKGAKLGYNITITFNCTKCNQLCGGAALLSAVQA